jgi:hypothetical protein
VTPGESLTLECGDCMKSFELTLEPSCRAAFQDQQRAEQLKLKGFKSRASYQAPIRFCPFCGGEGTLTRE